MQKIIDLALSHRARRAVFADEPKRLKRIESFVRAGAGPNQRGLLGRARRIRFVAIEVIFGQPAGCALNCFNTIWRPAIAALSIVATEVASAETAAATIDPTTSQLIFPLQRRTVATMSLASSGRAVSAAEVIAGAALRLFRTAPQTADRSSALSALSIVALPDKPLSIISAGESSRASAPGESTSQKAAASMPTPAKRKRKRTVLATHRRCERDLPGKSPMTYFHP